MKVANLKKLLQGLPDDVEVVMPGEDHSYRRLVTACHVVGLKSGKKLFEDDPRAGLVPGDERVDLVLVR